MDDLQDRCETLVENNDVLRPNSVKIDENLRKSKEDNIYGTYPKYISLVS